MTMKKIFAVLAITMILIGMPNTGSAQNTKGKHLEGTWNAVLIADGVDFMENERYTFIIGKSGNEGSLIFSNEVDTVPPCGTGQGVWARISRSRFAVTHGAFCSDLAMGGPAYSLKYREELTLNDPETQFTGKGILEIIDPAGNLLFSATYTIIGTRMKAEALTESSNEVEAASFLNQQPGEKFDWGRFRRTIPPK